LKKYTNLEIDKFDITIIPKLACASHQAVKYCKNKTKDNTLMHLTTVIKTKPKLACAKH
jgi:hypothetical protein